VSRGYALVLTLFVLAAAMFAGWLGADSIAYFPPSLMQQASTCPTGDGSYEPVMNSFEARLSSS
jgi:hypothetical protein